jgi:hypothetical protein
MQRTKAANRKTSLPSKTNTESPGYFADRSSLLGDAGTIITADDMNTIQEELVAVATLRGAALDAADNGQCAAALRPVLALESDSGAAGLSEASTSHAVAAIASLSVNVGGLGVVCAAAIASSGIGATASPSASLACVGDGTGGAASGAMSAIIASDVTGADSGASGTRAVVIATLASRASGASSLTAAGESLEAIGDRSACLGGEQNVSEADASVVLGGAQNAARGWGAVALGTIGAEIHGITAGVLGGTDCVADTEGSVVVGSQGAKVSSGANNYITMLASKHCDADLGNSGNGAPAYSVCGGFAAGADVAPSWRIDSNGGTMRSTNAHTTSGLDYAEMFENGEGRAHPPGRILTRKGRGARLAQAGERVLGVVSVMPTVVGGDDALGWRGRYLRDPWGGLLWSEAVQGDSHDRRRAGIPSAAREGPVRELAGNPAYDPRRPHTPRASRPTEWTCVGLLGQLRVAVDATVGPDDFVEPLRDGVGTKAQAETRLECMAVEHPFDPEKGFAVALCLLR